MKSVFRLAGCACILAAVCIGWAETPRADQPIAAPPVSPAPPPAAVRLAPPVGGTNAAGHPPPFAGQISADFIKKVMETSAKIEEAKRRIAERQEHLYATHPEIKAARARMIEGQQAINKILDADPQLADLKISRDILWSTMPAMPKGQNPAFIPRMPAPR